MLTMPVPSRGCCTVAESSSKSRSVPSVGLTRSNARLGALADGKRDREERARAERRGGAAGAPVLEDDRLLLRESECDRVGLRVAVHRQPLHLRRTDAATGHAAQLARIGIEQRAH